MAYRQCKKLLNRLLKMVWFVGAGKKSWQIDFSCGTRCSISGDRIRQHVWDQHSICYLFDFWNPFRYLLFNNAFNKGVCAKSHTKMTLPLVVIFMFESKQLLQRDIVLWFVARFLKAFGKCPYSKTQFCYTNLSLKRVFHIQKHHKHTKLV